MTSPDDALVFADEGADAPRATPVAAAPWKILVVDDEPSVHDVTRLALSGVSFDGRPLEFLSGYSGRDAITLLTEHPDVALVLLDVVMETEDAGLEAARRIREDLGNHLVRIVLRTGQPGQAPERRVITDYDINDYKEKTELTSAKLFTLAYASLRAYRDLMAIERSKAGLARIIDASADMFKLASVEQFAQGALQQLSALLRLRPGALYMRAQGDEANGVAARYIDHSWRAVAGMGRYEHPGAAALDAIIDPASLRDIHAALAAKSSGKYGDNYVAYFADNLGNQNLLLVEGVSDPDPDSLTLLDLFVRNISIASENIQLHAELDATQREIIVLLGEAVEVRSHETGNHVRRVAEISRILAEGLGLSAAEADLLRQASPLHDLGKIGVPDEILNKRSGLDPEELAIMRGHADVGYRMLNGSSRALLQAAATVAHEHHERWDGEGYPQRLSGEEIHLYGRITSVADVYDALLSPRCYKPAWSPGDVIAYFQEQRGRQFDPGVVDVLMARRAEIDAVRAALADPPPAA